MATLIEDVSDYVNKAMPLIGDIKVEHVQNDVDRYLNFTPEDLEKMDKQECVEAQYVILQYSLSILKKMNKYRATLSVNKRTFNRHLSQVYNSYNTYNGYDMVHATACAEHEYLRLMDNEICKIEALLQEFEGISAKVEKLSQIFRDLSFCKGN